MALLPSGSSNEAPALGAAKRMWLDGLELYVSAPACSFVPTGDIYPEAETA